MKSIIKIILLLLILLAGCNNEPTTAPVTPPRTGKGYYVSILGNDSNPGTLQLPWRTIQKSANTLLAGDTVYVMAGTYNEQVSPQNSGTSGNYIVYKNFLNDSVTIDGTGVILSNYAVGLFHIENRSYIMVSGFRVIKSGPNQNNSGICITTSDNVIIRKNNTYNTISSGIAAWTSSNITIDSNEVELACNDGEQECITVATTSNFEVKNNNVHNGGPGTIGGEGICIKDGSNYGRVFRNKVTNIPSRVAIYIDAHSRNTFNIDVYQNLIYNNVTAIQIASEQGALLQNIKIYDNLAYYNSLLGLMISDCCISTHPMQNIIIINNTFYNNGSGTWGGGLLNDNPQALNVIIRNNITSQNLTFQLALRDSSLLLSNTTADHNLIDGFRGYAGEIYGKDSVTGNPQFVNPAQNNFHLLINSPAIDRGASALAPVFDHDGISRPQGPGFDIGAYEYKP